MKKKYSVKELASILGCSVTAVNKKIKQDENNPVVKRYRNVFETVIENGITYILLDDSDLEEEKNRSKGFSNVINKGYNTPQDEEIIDVEPYQEEKRKDTLLEFTERYIDNITTMQKTFYEEMRSKDQQIYLLTTSENQKQAEYLETKALNKTLEKRNNVLKVALTVVITLLLTLATLFAMFYITISKEENKSVDIIEVQQVQNVPEVVEQPVVNVPQPPVTPVKKTYKKKAVTQ